MDGLNSDLEKANKSSSKLQKWAERLENEKLILRDDVDRMNRDAEIREANLRAEVERCGRLREDLINSREELNKIYLAKDVLEQQQLDSDNDIALLEKTKSKVGIICCLFLLNNIKFQVPLKWNLNKPCLKNQTHTRH
jgi:rootletin